MEVRFVPVAQAARELGKDRSGLYRRIRSGTLLTDGGENVVLVNGQLVSSVRDLVALMLPAQDPRVVDVRAGAAPPQELDRAPDPDPRLLARVAQLEQELQLAHHERELERSRAAADIAALAEAAERAHQAAAQAHSLAANATGLVRERAGRG